MKRATRPARWRLFVVLLGAMAHAEAGDWPAWRGPHGTGVSQDEGLPARWSAGESVRWTAELPARGVSSPVVANGRVYVTCASRPAQDRLHVLAFASSSGKRLWERQLWATGTTQCHPKTSMAAPTPAADRDGVFALFASFDAALFSAEGTLLWCRALALDFPGLSNQVGMAASPLVWRDLVILALETDSEALVLALDRKSGADRWKAPRARGINWSTPIFVETAGRAELVVQSPRGLSALDPASGAERWSHSGSFDAIASPASGGGRIFAPGARTVALEPPLAPGAPPRVVWESSKLRASTASLLFYAGRVWGVSSAGVLSCATAESGEVLWQERLEGPFSASPVAAGGRIYLVNESGVTTVVEASAEPAVAATCPLGEPVLASPAVAESALFLRTDRHLYRIQGS
jgi:outer membrane protein assembly factor BamB